MPAMATLKTLSAVTRRPLFKTGRVCMSTALDCLTRKHYPIVIQKPVSQEAIKIVCCSSSALSHHSYKTPNHQSQLLIFNIVASSHANVGDRRYICPSRLSQLFSQLVIMDNLTDVQSRYDCPVSNTVNINKVTPASQSGKAEILEPPVGRQRTDSKEAKEIMRIRHKKMKKHKLRKLRKRMYFLWRKQKATRKAKRNAIYWKEISDIKQEAEDFNAETFVKEQLEKARKGGHYIKVLDSKV